MTFTLVPYCISIVARNKSVGFAHFQPLWGETDTLLCGPPFCFFALLLLWDYFFAPPDASTRGRFCILLAVPGGFLLSCVIVQF